MSTDSVDNLKRYLHSNHPLPYVAQLGLPVLAALWIMLASWTTAGEDECPAGKKPRPRLYGRVTDLAGQPVGPYRILAAAMSDPDASDGGGPYYHEEELKGVPLGKPWEVILYGDAEFYWIMAEVPGFAPATTIVPHNAIARPVDLRLGPGFSFAGRISLSDDAAPRTAVKDTKDTASVPSPATEIVVMAQPMYLFDSNPAYQHETSSPLHKLQVSQGNPRRDGRFRFEHLAPGIYMVQAAAPGRTPAERLVTLGDRDLRWDEPLPLIPAGRIEGIVCDDEGKPMVMGQCYWSAPITIDWRIGETLWGENLGGPQSGVFTTDENGRFILQNVPAGRHVVGFNRPRGGLFGRREHEVQVLPGRTTQVQINLPPDAANCWKAPVEVTVGDGSREDLIAGGRITNPKFFDTDSRKAAAPLALPLYLEPIPGQVVSWPQFSWPWTPGTAPIAIPLSGGVGRAVWTGFHPGKYRVTNKTDSWLCSDCGPAETSATDAREIGIAKPPLRVTLPAASVEVDYQHPKEDVKHWVVLLRALDEDGKPIRQTFTSTGYPQAVRPNTRPGLEFVPPGRYTLLAWRDGLGWARSGPVQVERSKIANGGVLKLQPGGTIRGRIPLPQVSKVPVCVVATDSHGIALEAEARWKYEGYSFTATDLWPETWTIAALDIDRHPIVQWTVTLKGTETANIE